MQQPQTPNIHFIQPLSFSRLDGDSESLEPAATFLRNRWFPLPSGIEHSLFYHLLQPICFLHYLLNLFAANCRLHHSILL